MKNILFITAFALISHLAAAQKTCPCYAGVYFTKEDFLKNHLSYKIDESVKGEKLTFTFPSDITLTLKIVEQDTVVKFKPGTIYGYYECGEVYRYSPGTELNAQEDFYKIEEDKGLVIYSSVFISGTESFYSLNLTAPIHRLTAKNLEVDFSNHTRFIKAMKKANKKVEGLGAQDDKGGYVINKIYAATMPALRKHKLSE